MNHKQKGFSTVALLALIVIIGAVGFAGWRVLRKASPTRSNNTASSQKMFTSYADCSQRGGKMLNAEFSACLGGNNKLFLDYNAQNLPRLDERKTATEPNTVEYDGNYSADLISFLRQDGEGCKGYFKILREVPGRFAKLNYGCDNDTPQNKSSAFMIAIKLADGWSLISPTNQFDEQGVPGCLMVDMFKIPKTLEPKCFEGTMMEHSGKLNDVHYL